MSELKDELAGLKVDKRIKRANQIKADAEGSDYYELIKIELEDIENSVLDALGTCTNKNDLPLIVGGYQALKKIETLIFTDWSK